MHLAKGRTNGDTLLSSFQSLHRQCIIVSTILLIIFFHDTSLTIFNTVSVWRMKLANLSTVQVYTVQLYKSVHPLEYRSIEWYPNVKRSLLALAAIPPLCLPLGRVRSPDLLRVHGAHVPACGLSLHDTLHSHHLSADRHAHITATLVSWRGKLLSCPTVSSSLCLSVSLSLSLSISVSLSFSLCLSLSLSLCLSLSISLFLFLPLFISLSLFLCLCHSLYSFFFSLSLFLIISLSLSICFSVSLCTPSVSLSYILLFSLPSFTLYLPLIFSLSHSLLSRNIWDISYLHELVDMLVVRTFQYQCKCVWNLSMYILSHFTPWKVIKIYDFIMLSLSKIQPKVPMPQ